MKKTLCLVFIVIYILILGGCAHTDNNQLNDFRKESTETVTMTKESTAVDNTKYASGAAGTVEEIETTQSDSNTPEWNVLENDTLIEELTFEGQTEYYTFIAPETGIYRFSLGIDKVTKRYSIELYAENEELLGDSEYRDDESGFNVELTKGSKYTVKINQIEGDPICSIKIGIPKSIRSVTDNVCSDNFIFKGQQDIWTFTPEISGRFGFELDISNVQYTYTLFIYNSKDQKILERRYNSDLTNGCFDIAELDKGEKYSIYIIFDDYIFEEKLSYFIKIYEPDARKVIESNVIEGDFRFKEERDEYIFIPSKTADYTLYFEDNNSLMTYSVKVINTKNADIGSTYNHSTSSSFELQKDEEYTIVLEQESDYGKYKVSIIEYDE